MIFDGCGDTAELRCNPAESLTHQGMVCSLRVAVCGFRDGMGDFQEREGDGEAAIPGSRLSLAEIRDVFSH
jgi:hypothetical protein